jgi:hypothetical protein
LLCSLDPYPIFFQQVARGGDGATRRCFFLSVSELWGTNRAIRALGVWSTFTGRFEELNEMMKKLAVWTGAVAMLALPVGSAHADLVLTNFNLSGGNGFGAVTTIMTWQRVGSSQSPTGIETGCNSFTATSTFGAYDPSKTDFCNEGAPNDVPNGTPKTALPSLSSLGITSVSQIGTVLNINQSNPTSGITVNDLALTFYTSTGTPIFTATLPDNWCNIGSFCSGPNTFSTFANGQGQAGYAFALTAGQQALLLAAMGGTFNGSILVGAGGVLGCSGNAGTDCKLADAGAESLQLANLNTPITTPEPSTVALTASGLIGLVGIGRRRRNKK